VEAPRRTEIPPKSPVRKTSSAALPKEDEDVFSLMPIKERKRIFEELARQGERNRLNQRFFKLRVSTLYRVAKCPKRVAKFEKKKIFANIAANKPKIKS